MLKFMAPRPAHWMPEYKTEKDKTLREIRSHLENESSGDLLNFKLAGTTALSTIFSCLLLAPSQLPLLGWLSYRSERPPGCDWRWV